MTASAPPVIEAGPCVPTATPGEWRARWALRPAAALAVEEVWAPHDHFFSPRFTPPAALRAEPGEVFWLERPVRCTDPPGSVIENAFLILRCAGSRVFARLTVRVDATGTPQQVCESVTAQPLLKGGDHGSQCRRP